MKKEEIRLESIRRNLMDCFLKLEDLNKGTIGWNELLEAERLAHKAIQQIEQYQENLL